jgi:hypothetical protein
MSCPESETWIWKSGAHISTLIWFVWMQAVLPHTTYLFWNNMGLQFCVLQPQGFDGEAELQVCRLWDEGGSRICQQVSLLWISWPILLYWLPCKSACTYPREDIHQVGLHTVGACCGIVYNICSYCIMFESGSVFFGLCDRMHFFMLYSESLLCFRHVCGWFV